MLVVLAVGTAGGYVALRLRVPAGALVGSLVARRRLAEGPILLAPGVYDALSAAVSSPAAWAFRI